MRGDVVDDTVRSFDSVVQRVSAELDHFRSKTLSTAFRIAWVRLRSIILREVIDVTEKDEHEVCVAFWETHLEEPYELGRDMTLIFHDSDREMVCEELLWQ